MPETLTTADPAAPAAGVTAWFVPRTENHIHDPAIAELPVSVSTTRGVQQWATGEMVRRFTTIGQHYSIIGIATPVLYEADVEQATISRRRRTTGEGMPDRDEETSIRAGYDLVAIVATDRGEPDYQAMDYDFRRHGHPLATPDGTTLTGLITGAKRMLADGGTLAVQLPGSVPGESCADGTSGVIADAERAGLSYLQRIAVVGSPIDGEQMAPAAPEAALDGFSDLLVFRKPDKENTLG